MMLLHVNVRHSDANPLYDEGVGGHKRESHPASDCLQDRERDVSVLVHDGR
jgi:hypothetical protein